MSNKIKQLITDCLGFELILQTDSKGFLIGSYTEQGGSYPLLDFEREIIFNKLGIIRKQDI